MNHYDMIVVGSGAGGATLTYSLRDSGLRILVLERGKHLPQEPENSSPYEVFQRRRYHTTERWQDLVSRKSIRPKEFYWVGGKTKVYGATMLRLREEDFLEREHPDGVSPAWPITYDELRPYYESAERLYLVHGQAGADPTEPSAFRHYPFPPLPDSDYMDQLAAGLKRQGLKPFPIPIGIDYRPGGPCLYCRTCDGYPCPVHAKSDAEVRCLQPALRRQNIELMTDAWAKRLLLDGAGLVCGVEVVHDGETKILRADRYVISCGAIQSAALLLRSACATHPTGIANRSGQVGRNLMFHNATGMVGIHWTRKNTAIFQKTLCLMDYYHGAPDWPYPMGAVQTLGFYPLQYNGVPWIGGFINRRSIQFFALSEDLPSVDNRVVAMEGDAIGIQYRPNNLESHRRLVGRVRRHFRRAGYSLVASQFVAQPKDAGAHECGTLRFGNDPRSSVLDSYCRSHDHGNLFVVDASFFPSSAAVNPALTIVAQALRVGEHLGGEKIERSSPAIASTSLPILSGTTRGE